MKLFSYIALIAALILKKVYGLVPPPPYWHEDKLCEGGQQGERQDIEIKLEKEVESWDECKNECQSLAEGDLSFLYKKTCCECDHIDPINEGLNKYICKLKITD